MPGYNAYFFFYQEYKRKLPLWRNKTKKEIDEFVRNSWRTCSEDERKQFFEMERENKERIEAAQKRDMEMQMRLKLNEATITNMIDNQTIEHIVEEKFFVIYCHKFVKVDDPDVTVPAEVSIARFSLHYGVEEVFQAFPEPGAIPPGYKGRCFEHSKRSHQIPLDPNNNERGVNIKRVDDGKLFEEIKAFLAGGNKIFTMPDALAEVEGVLNTIAKRSDQVKFVETIHLLPLPSLLMKLANKPCQDDKVMPVLSLAEHELLQQRFQYYPGFNCDWHDKMTETSNCSSAIVRRWSFTVLGICCSQYNLDMVPGMHVPTLS